MCTWLRGGCQVAHKGAAAPCVKLLQGGMLRHYSLVVCARRPCIAAVAAFVVAQVLKLFTYWYSERRWDFTRLIGSGGMPSSHTGCVRRRLHYSPCVEGSSVCAPAR